MERAYSQTALNALAESERELGFVELDWQGNWVRAHTGLGTRPFAGVDFLGVGELGGISAVNEEQGYSPGQLTFTLKVLDPTLVNIVMNANPRGCECFLHIATLDDNRVIEHELPYVFDGYIDDVKVTRGDVTKNIPYLISISAYDWLNRWNQPADNGRTTDQAHQNLHPGDTFFDQTEIIAASPLSSLPIKNARYNDYDYGDYR